MASATFAPACRVVSCSRSKPASRAIACNASGAEHGQQRRRALLLGGATGVVLAGAPPSRALEKFDLPIDQLSAFDRAEQRAELVERAGIAIRKVLTADDAVIALRLAVNDAGTYDVVTKTGGFDASIILNKAEASRPENKGFENYIAKLGKAKAELDASNAELGAEPMSWTDMMFLGVKVTREAEWRRIKVSRAAIPSGGDTIVKTFGSEWTLKLGRLDSTNEPVNRCLAPGASTAEMESFYLKLGAKPNDTGPFAAKPPFWPKYSFLMYPAAQDDPKAYEEMLAADSKEFAKWKLDYDRSRATVTRTNYEVDFINTFTRMTSLGAKFNPDAYLHTRPSYKYG